MPTHVRHEAGLAHTLVVLLDGATVPGVTGVAGLGFGREVVELREGNDPLGATRRLPGRQEGGDLRLTRALRTDPTFEAWVRGPGPDGVAVATRDLRVRFFDVHGAPVRRYRLVGAWARALEITGSTVAGGGGLLEVLTVSYDVCLTDTT